jgi:hypothetical protein
MASGGWLRSRPRVRGTTQKVQCFSQPSGDVRLQPVRGRRPRRDLDQRRLARLEHGTPVAPDALDELGDTRDGRRAEHEIDVRRALLDDALLELRHAPHDTDNHVRPARLERAQLAELREHLVLGLLPDRARVDEDEVGVGLAVGQLVAVSSQQAGHPLRVVLVHLTAVGDDV